MRWVKIFTSTKEASGKISENKPQLLLVEGKRVCLVRRENNLYAVGDRCPHNGESLSKGTVNFAGEIVCPWHGHQFSLKTGREFQERSQDIECYPIKEEADGLYLGI
jgi:nitrite reductase/ring-hydroxylating ferredoxin subunit